MAEQQFKYDNPTKATWRGWAWNQVASRVPKGSTVMVLCGDSALDVAQAEKRGMSCIGVDCVDSCVDTFRQKGGVAINDRLHRQIILQKPDAIILDFLGGLNDTSFSNFFCAICSTKCVVTNFLRGRDKAGAKICSDFGDREVTCFVKGRPRRRKIEKHRGLALLYCMFAHSASANDISDEEGIHEFVSRAFRILRPEVFSYQSKDSPGMYYDSCAITVPSMLNQDIPLQDTTRVLKSKRKAAAAKAVLTMKRKKLVDKFKPFAMN